MSNLDPNTEFCCPVCGDVVTPDHQRSRCPGRNTAHLTIDTYRRRN